MKMRVTVCIDCDEDNVLELEAFVEEMRVILVNNYDNLVNDPNYNFDVATDKVKD